MRFAVLTTTTTALVLASVCADVPSKTYPGRCTSTKDCVTLYGSNFSCISVESDYPGLELLSMCVPGQQICSGTIAGICPTFGAWPAKYQKVMPVCAFVTVDNCNKQFQVTQTGTDNAQITLNTTFANTTHSSNSTIRSLLLAAATTTSKPLLANETVECYQRNFTVNGQSAMVNGIYKCMDSHKYLTTDGGHIQNLTQSQILACGGNQTSGNIVLCNGQGTCSPKVAFSQEYECKCNKGYESDAYCSHPTSNECSNLGQCGSFGNCLLANGTGQCTCKDGAKGDQCSMCDATAKNGGCGANGKCNNETGVCDCKTGYNGTFCAAIPGTDTSSSAYPLQRMALSMTLWGLGAFVVFW